MNLLLDTHIAIWALNDSPELSAKARKLILDPNNIISGELKGDEVIKRRPVSHLKIIKSLPNEQLSLF